MQKIRSSLSAKVFLWVLSALTICSLLIYGIVMVIIPRQYTAISSSRINDEIERLSQELENVDSQTASEKIYNFCIKNNSAALLQTGENSVSFGEIEYLEEEDSSFTVSLILQLSDCETESYLAIVVSPSTAEEINYTFLKILPGVLVIILLISAGSAWVCSRVIVRPVLEICNVSKKMAQMDMTWRCNVDRRDELGILADSLNTLSLKLTQAMDELETANAKLRQEVETVNAFEKQRRDFFAAASHELKTPITILKGQIESMILEIGKYKDVKKLLPETLHEVENMERLVKEILTISKIEINGLADKTDSIAVHEELEKVTELLEPLAKEKEIVIYQNLKTVWIEGNDLLFQKALHNIITNAIRHSPNKSEVFIKLTEKCLSVQNTGITIPEREIPDLFNPFYRVEKSRNKATGGSGLGLYLVKTILELHGLSFSITNGDNSVIFTIIFESENEIKTKF